MVFEMALQLVIKAIQENNNSTTVLAYLDNILWWDQLSVQWSYFPINTIETFVPDHMSQTVFRISHEI